VLKGFKECARPFGIYLGSVAICGATFAPWVEMEKIVLLLTLVGTLAGLRTIDKRITTPAG